MPSTDWVRVSRERPCPICGKADNCSLSRDGSAVWCGRVSDGSIQSNAGGQFLHRLRDRNEWSDRPRALPTNRATNAPKISTKDWGQIARQELATLLGVSVEALRRLGVGWLGAARGWSFPERDASGKVVGINRRLVNGQKRREAGGQSGLTFDPGGWFDSASDPDSVFLVEGGSDVAAMLSHGLSAVGRPSNTGGVELLGELLKQVPESRMVVVIGEHDRRPHGSLTPAQQRGHSPDCVGCSKCWPGWFGATRTAERLAVILGRQIAWAMPPDGAKDAREWLRHFETRTDST